VELIAVTALDTSLRPRNEEAIAFHLVAGEQFTATGSIIRRLVRPQSE